MEEPGARGTRGTGLRIAPQHLGLMAGSAWVCLLAFHFQLVLAELGSGRWGGGNSLCWSPFRVGFPGRSGSQPWLEGAERGRATVNVEPWGGFRAFRALPGRGWDLRAGLLRTRSLRAVAWGRRAAGGAAGGAPDGPHPPQGCSCVTWFSGAKPPSRSRVGPYRRRWEFTGTSGRSGVRVTCSANGREPTFGRWLQSPLLINDANGNRSLLLSSAVYSGALKKQRSPSDLFCCDVAEASTVSLVSSAVPAFPRRSDTGR